MQEEPKNIQQNSAAQQSSQQPLQPDAANMNDSKTNVDSDNLQQGMTGHELNPEFGDAADPHQRRISHAP